MSALVSCGFVPLVDAAPLVIAREIGFASEEGIDLVLHRQPSWSTLRDRLAVGSLDFAHMLAPVPIAMSLGLGGLPVPLGVPYVLSVNGTVMGVSAPLSARLPEFDRSDAVSAGRALLAASGETLRVGVPFPFSMHVELLDYWLRAVGGDALPTLSVKTVPPPLMANAIADGEIDAFCVGEPWGSVTVENGAGEIILPGTAIWQFAPEKVLAARQDFLEDNRFVTEKVVRALWRASHWLSMPANRGTASELLAGAAYLDRPAELIERAMTGDLIVSSRGEMLRVPRMIEFHDCAANFPWRSQAMWIADRLATRNGLDRQESTVQARDCFRPDIYRAALGPLEIDLPGASEKVEGALSELTAVASSKGTLSLGPDQFFDGRIFD